jgi:threonylcarbamoyladenosine tRNA methylthiotransferase MtaB
MKASIITLGCKVNQFESASMLEALEKAGYELGPYSLEQGLIVLNTCAVTHRAEKEAFQILRRLKRENPKAKIIVTGCLANALPEDLKNEGADLIIGNSQKDFLVSFLDKPIGTIDIELGQKEEGFSYTGAPKQERTRAFLKLQDGCNASCAYCVIPQLRGKSRSQEKEKAIAQILAYKEQGFREIVLTGIHLGQWGKDLPSAEDLLSLLESIETIINPDPMDFRIRLSSLEPNEVFSIVDVFNKYPWIARHLHIPLQAGSDKILKLMNRPYKTSFYYDLIVSLQKLYPYMSLGADIITGFPGETDKDFKEGFTFVKELPLNYLHVFPFSVRPNTKAAEMSDYVSEPKKKERVKMYKALDKEKRENFLSVNYEREEIALVENTLHAVSGLQKVLTSNYISALLQNGDPGYFGKLLKVTIEKSNNSYGKPEARVVV